MTSKKQSQPSTTLFPEGLTVPSVDVRSMEGSRESSGLTLNEFVEDRRKQRLETFVEKHPWPVLLYAVDQETSTGRAFQTKMTEPDATEMEIELGLHADPFMPVFLVRKREGGPFADRIGVGRSRGTDVHLPFPDISKYHAFFTWNADRTEYFLTDAGSKNGTKVDGVALEPRLAVPIADRSIIGFSHRNFRFHVPSGLYRVVGLLVFGSP